MNFLLESDLRKTIAFTNKVDLARFGGVCKAYRKLCTSEIYWNAHLEELVHDIGPHIFHFVHQLDLSSFILHGLCANKSKDQIESTIKLVFLLKAVTYPPSDQRFVQFRASIFINGTMSDMTGKQELILHPSQMRLEEDECPRFVLTFFPNPSKRIVLLCGQDGFFSSLKVQILNRANRECLLTDVINASAGMLYPIPRSQNRSQDRFHFGYGPGYQSPSLKVKITTCSSTTLRFLGRIMRGSEQAFMGTSMSYDFDDGHAGIRGGGSSHPMTTTRMGANAAYEVQKICVTIPVKDLDNFFVPPASRNSHMQG